jgi:hypothetical protein
MDELKWIPDQHDKPILYNVNTELPHICESYKKKNDYDIKYDELDYWICLEHKKSLVIKPHRFYCPVHDCSQSNFIRKSYHDTLEKITLAKNNESSKDNQNKNNVWEILWKPNAVLSKSEKPICHEILRKTTEIEELDDWIRYYFDLPNYLKLCEERTESVILLNFDNGEYCMSNTIY